MDYDPVREQYVIWKGDASIWYLKAPEVLSASGWTVEKAPVSSSPAPTIPNLFTGVLGKWDYVDQYDVFIGVNNAHTGDIWIYKPEGWSPRCW